MEKSDKIHKKATTSRAGNHFLENNSEQVFFADNTTPQHAESFFKPAKHSTNSIQTKLAIGSSNDKYEIEADAIADEVLNNYQTYNYEIATDEEKENFVNQKTLADTVSLKKDLGKNEENQIDTQTEDQIKNSKGKGSPMSSATRSFMENRFGTDFSSVNIHTDTNAIQLNQELGAKAFAYGNDIYFNQGAYNPETNSGKHLLAHELTHTLQQGNGVALSVQKSTEKKGKKKAKKEDTQKEVEEADNLEVEKKDTYENTETKESIDTKSKKIVLKSLPVPTIKAKPSSQKILISKNKEKRDNTQIAIWEKNALVNKEVIRKRFNGKKTTTKNTKPEEDADEKKTIHYLKLNKSTDDVLFGTFDNLAPRLVRPYWNKKGQRNYYDVDHKLELQLGGKNEITNLWLLDAQMNRSSGSQIKDRIAKTVDDFIAKANPYLITPLVSYSESVKEKYDIEYLQGGVADASMDVGGNKKENPFWNLEEVKDGLPLDGLKLLTEAEVAKGGYAGKKDMLILYRGALGGYAIKIPWGEKKQNASGLSLYFKKYDKNLIMIHSVTYDSEAEEGDTGKNFVNASLVDKALERKELKFYIQKLEGIEYGGRIEYLSFQKALTEAELELKGMSPIKVTYVKLDEDDFRIEGKVLPTIPLIKDADIDIIITDEGVKIRKLFTKSDFKLPAPFNITNSSLEIYFSGNNAGLDGMLDFEIKNLGEGSINGKFSIKKGFQLNGAFSFDSNFFNPARIKLKYENDKWEIGGTIGITENKIKGIKKAKLDLNYADGKLTAEGDALLNIPGIEEVKLNAEFDENGNFKIKGDATLKELPGIKSGRAAVTVSSGDDGLKLRLEGKAVPNLSKVPGLDAELNLLYDDGLFEMSTQVNYNKGRFNGIIQVGITNRSVNEKGEAEGEPDSTGDLRIFGFGSLAVQVFKNTSAQVDVRLTQTGEVMVGGEIKTENLKMFGDGYHINNKELLKIPQITIPLLGVPGLSLSAFIKGGVYFSFNWDPLVLKELSLKLQEVNINELDKAQLDIHGSIGSIANAEVYLSVDVGIEGRALVAVVQGSIGGQAGLGIKAEAGGEIDAGWDMDKGLQLKEIRANLEATPYALFRLLGKVSVDLDVWLAKINLYYHEWVLADGKLDLSGLDLKVKFPIKFDENNNLIFPTMDQLEIKKPDFSGSQGKELMNKAINADAEKEMAQKKERIRSEIVSGLRKKKNDTNFSYSTYKEEMIKKYGDSKELKSFVLDIIEEETKKIERERFTKVKAELKTSTAPLQAKKNKLAMHMLTNKYVSIEEINNFIKELENDELIKQQNDTY